MGRHKKLGRKRTLTPKQAQRNKMDYDNAYNKEHTKSLAIRLSYSTDKDIIDKMETIDNKAGYIKTLIREDIKKGE